MCAYSRKDLLALNLIFPFCVVLYIHIHLSSSIAIKYCQKSKGINHKIISRWIGIYWLSHHVSVGYNKKYKAWVFVILKGSISIIWILINLQVTFNEKGNTADHNIKMCKASNPWRQKVHLPILNLRIDLKHAHTTWKTICRLYRF